MHTTIPRSSQLLVLAAVLCTAATAWGQELTAAEAVRIALEQNPSLQATVMDLRAAGQSVEAAEAERTPVFRAGLGGGYDTSFGARALGVVPEHDGDMELDVGIGWVSRVGTELSFEVAGTWNTRESTRDSSSSNLDDFTSNYGAEALLKVTQPLLRGAGRDVGEANERAARWSQTAAEHARDDAASALINDVMNAYWELWYAQETVEVNREAKALAERQLAEAETRVSTLGTMSRVDALRFASELASIEEDLSQAEADLRTRAVELGRLLGISPSEAQTISAADQEPAYNATLTADEVIEMAQHESSALRALEAELEASQDRVQVARDATLPRLDLTASMGMGGLWNDTSSAAGYQPGADLGLNAMIGLSLELPLSTGRARAQLAETRSRLDAAELRYEARERQVEVEALTTLERLETARSRVDLASRSIEIDRELAEAEQEALRLGTSTTYQALEAQASLRRSELRRLRALIDQTKAAITLQHLTGQLLPEYAELAGER